MTAWLYEILLAITLGFLAYRVIKKKVFPALDAAEARDAAQEQALKQDYALRREECHNLDEAQKATRELYEQQRINIEQWRIARDAEQAALMQQRRDHEIILRQRLYEQRRAGEELHARRETMNRAFEDAEKQLRARYSSAEEQHAYLERVLQHDEQ